MQFITKTTITTTLTVLVGLVLILGGFGINDAGYRTVVQYPTGTTWVKFSPGWYLTFFGKTEKYPDVLTFDYDDVQDEDSSVQENGLAVRYQDGGMGTTYGKDRFLLPTDEPAMLALHKSFRSTAGLANKLIRPVVKEAHQMTAGLMSSEGAYAEQRGTYISWVQDQVRNGKYVTELSTTTVTDEVTNKIISKKVPVISTKNGVPLHVPSDLATYGVDLQGSQITNWDFEQKTLVQISKKREATMAIITARADAERAKQDAITAEEKGKANVMTAKYEKEVEKERAVVDAEREKQVAEIKAAQLVEVARQGQLEAEQHKLAAKETKQKDILLGQGEAERKRLVMEADGALQQKLEAYKEVNFAYAQAMSQHKWVPEIQMGGNSDGNSSAAQDLLDMFKVKTAKELSLDMSVKK